MHIMEAPTATPAGFCPKCYYPIDPGVCPECGTASTADTILTSLSQTRSAKTRRWLLRAFLFIILPLAAVIGGRYVHWASFVPTEWLFSIQGDAKHWTTRELVERFASGNLSKDQATRLINEVVVIDFFMRKTAPVVPAIAYRLCLRVDVARGAGYTIEANALCSEVRVDGKKASEAGYSMGVSSGGSSIVSSELEGLGPGKHAVEILLHLAVSAGAPQTIRYDLNRSIKAAITIVDEPATKFIRLECNPELTARMKTVLKAGLSYGEFCDLSDERAGAMPIPVAGKLQWRPSGSKKFADAGSVAWAEDWGIDGSNCEQVQTGDAELIDIRIVPDVNVAIRRLGDSCRQIYGCTLEWDTLCRSERRGDSPKVLSP